MNIKKYSSYFHDGELSSVEQKNNHIEISMESNQLYPEWNEDNIPLSNFLTIKGKLHLEGVRSLIINHNFSDAIKIGYNDSTILDFDVLSDNKIRLLTSWTNFPLKPEINHCDLIEIEADKIYWENIPDLED